MHLNSNINKISRLPFNFSPLGQLLYSSLFFFIKKKFDLTNQKNCNEFCFFFVAHTCRCF